jgi:hypothetical protein
VEEDKEVWIIQACLILPDPFRISFHFETLTERSPREVFRM